jgi:hypothetical protein
MPEARTDLVAEQAFVEVVADNIEDNGACAILAYGLLSPDQVLTQWGARSGEAVDPELAREVMRKPPLHGLGIRHHLRLDIGISDDRDQRQRVLAAIILVVDVTHVVDAAARDVLQIPVHGENKGAVRRGPEYRVCRVDLHRPQPGIDGEEAQHDLGQHENDDDRDDRREEREQECPASTQARPGARIGRLRLMHVITLKIR